MNLTLSKITYFCFSVADWDLAHTVSKIPWKLRVRKDILVVFFQLENQGLRKTNRLELLMLTFFSGMVLHVRLQKR